MKPISLEDVCTLQRARQYFCDCYLVSSLNILTRTKNGRKLLQQNIKTDDNNYLIRFNDVYGKVEDYFVSQKECQNLILYDRFLNVIPIKEPHNPIVKAVEVAMNKLIDKHYFKKPLISRLIKCQENFEYNKPSNFLKMFTGFNPIKINESSLRMTLSKQEDKLFEIFSKMSQEDSGFMAGTGLTNDNLLSWHCYPISNVNFSTKTLSIHNNRDFEVQKLDWHTFTSKIKYICGYFNENLR